MFAITLVITVPPVVTATVGRYRYTTKGVRAGAGRTRRQPVERVAAVLTPGSAIEPADQRPKQPSAPFRLSAQSVPASAKQPRHRGDSGQFAQDRCAANPGWFGNQRGIGIT
jgi:hypothetical protein